MADRRQTQLLVEQLCKLLFEDCQLTDCYLASGGKAIGEILVKGDGFKGTTVFIQIDARTKMWCLFGTERLATGELDSPNMGVKKTIRVTPRS